MCEVCRRAWIPANHRASHFLQDWAIGFRNRNLDSYGAKNRREVAIIRARNGYGTTRTITKITTSTITTKPF